MSKKYSPALLPEVDEVEIVNLGGIRPGDVSGYTKATAGISGIKVTGNLAYLICSLWRKLPPGNMHRCHTPPYELRFTYKAGGGLQASVCWSCNNIFLVENGEDGYCTLDNTSRIAKSLLKLIRYIETGAY